MNHDPAKQAWQASVDIAGPPPLEEVRRGADKFYRYVWWRNMIEYVACAAVVVIFTIYVFTMPHILQKIGSVLIIAAALYTPWQLHRRASADPPEKAGEMPIYRFLRAQLVRQRDALKGIFRWYILPFIPGMALIMIGNAFDPRFTAQGPGVTVKWLAFAGAGIVVGVIWWLNQLAARRLQRHVDEIDALTEGTE